MTREISRRRVLHGIAGSVAVGAIGPVFAFGQSKSQAITSQSEIGKLRAGLKGSLILPNDAGYDAARRVGSFNPTSDKHPLVIVRCAEPGDIVRAIGFARDHSIDVAVRSGGHDLLGASVCDGMVIDVSRMKGIEVDSRKLTTKVESGVRASELNAAAQRTRLVPILGCSPTVGVAGLTLGGGLGWFLGKHGAACDNLIGADIVTADAKMIRATSTENADLFWALKGGGGNFGLVTSLDYQLHPVDQVIGGVVAYRTDVSKFLHFYRDFMSNAPDELAVELGIYFSKQPLITALVCWSGNPGVGKRVLSALKSFDPPIVDNVEVIPFSRLGERFAIIGQLLSQGSPQSAQSTPQPPKQNDGPAYGYWRGASLSQLNSAAIDKMVATIENAPWVRRSIGIGHYMHGQVCRVDQSTTPLQRKRGQLTYFFNSSWLDPRLAESEMAWVNRALTAMKTSSNAGTYINYLSSDREADIKASYAHSYERLAKIKKKYDPDNFFHHNRNIRPTKV